FAGAVRPDQAAQLALGQRKIDAAHCLNSAEMLAQSARLDQGSAHALPPWVISRDATAGRRRRSNQGTSRSVTIGATPLGTKRTKIIRTAPSTTFALTVCCVPIFTVSQEIRTAPITGPSNVPAPPTMSQMIIC